MKKLKNFFTVSRKKKIASSASGTTKSTNAIAEKANKFNTVPAKPNKKMAATVLREQEILEEEPPVQVEESLDFLSAIEKQIIEEVNRVRLDPLSFVPILENRKQYYDDEEKTLSLPGQSILVTEEGVTAVIEAIDFLKTKTKPLPKLRASRGICLACRDHVKDLGATGGTDHKGSDGSDVRSRLARYAAEFWQEGGGLTTGEHLGFSVGEDSEQNTFNVGQEIVLQTIIEDGNPSRQHRLNLFNENLTVFGAAYGKHSAYETMYCIVFASRFAEKGEKRPTNTVTKKKITTAPAEASRSLPVDEKICGVCRKDLGERRIVVEGRRIHPDCFKCAHCNLRLEGGPKFYTQDGKFYCEKDYWELFGDKCAECGLVIQGNVMEVGEKKWHPRCFPDMAL